MRQGKLSKRETEMAELLAWGASKKEVATMLYVSPRTVENTARNIYEKLGVKSVAQLSAWWFCTKYHISAALNPLAKPVLALLFIMLMISNEILSDDDQVLRTTRTSRVIKVRGSKSRRREGCL